MINIFHRSREFVEKHKQHHHFVLAVLALVIAGTGVYTFRQEIVQAATYTIFQTSWGGTVGGGTVTHSPDGNNQTSWDGYSNASSTISAGANDVRLFSANYSFTDDGSTTPGSPDSSGGGFSSGVYSATIATTTASGASVGLIGTSANTWSSMATTPLATGYGGSLVYPGSGDYIYGYRGGNTTTFYRYSISGNSWTAMATTPAAIATGPTYTGTILTYPGSGDFIYGYRGNSTAFYRYSITDNTWTSMAPALAAITAGNALTSAGGDIYGAQGSTLYKYSIAGNSWVSLGAISGGNSYGSSLMYPGSGDYIYALVSSNPYLRRYSISGGTWSSLATPPAVNSHGATLVYPGSGDYIYTYQGATNAFYRYSIIGNSWTTMAVVPGTTTAGGSLVYPGSGNYIYGFQGSSNAFYRYSIANYYNSPGTFTSNTIDFARPTIFTDMTVASTTPSGTSISMKARSSPTGLDGSWRTNSGPSDSWDNCTPTTAGTFDMSALGCVTDGDRYIQYRATLSNTGDTTATPTLDSVIINDTQFSADGGALISSKYDSGDPTNQVSKITWTGSATSTTETIKFQVRTASSAGGLDSAPWCGYADTGTCTGSNYFEYTHSGVSITDTSHPLRSGENDEFVQYRVVFASGGAISPILDDVTVQYVVNAAPVITITTPTVSQASDGTVTVTYDLVDSDTVQPPLPYAGKADVTLQYCTTNCNTGNEVWADAVTVSGAVGSGVLLGTGKTVVWTSPYTDYSPQHKANTQKIRIKAYDGEGANHTGYSSASNTFTLDTTLPVISTAIIDSSAGASTAVGNTAGTITLTVTDTSTKQYRLCNDSSFPATPATDAQGNSCDWTSLAAAVEGVTPTWVFPGASADEAVYMQARDQYGNTTATRTIVAPAMPANFDYTDASNTGLGVYREFLSWAPFVATTSSTFGSYKVYHSLDNFATAGDLIITIADSATNYYAHTITANTDVAHYYRVVTTNANGDVSNYTAVKSDIPDGTGGTDTTAPYIPTSGIATSSVGNSSIKITFSTYTDSTMQAPGELATSTVEYSTLSANDYTSRVNTTTYTVNHSVYLSGLMPNTTYVFQVKAKDIANNTSAAVSGGRFTTLGGPVITNVTEREITDNSAKIFWNTNTSSNSVVCYGITTSAADSCATSKTEPIVTTSGTNPVTGTYYQHQVGLTGLSTGLRYYYKVSSTDALGASSTDNDTGNYYSFVTLTDTSAPVISATSTPVLASDVVVIVWQTDELSTGQVFYDTVSRGGNTAQYAYNTAIQTVPSIFHVSTLSSASDRYDVNHAVERTSALGGNGLLADTPYYTAVKSVDEAGNIASSDEWLFRTTVDGTAIVEGGSSSRRQEGTTPDTSAPIVSNVKVSSITPFGATVTFDTDEDADGFVKYGKDVSYGDIAGDDVWGKNHTIKLRGLLMGTEYHMQVVSHDKAGNTGTSADQTFKTTFLTENLKDLAKFENIEAFQKEIEDTIESILPSLVPPFITKPIVSDITESGAKVTFKSNIKAFPVVAYVEDGAYDETKESPYTGEVSDTTEKSTSHEMLLTGLKGNTKYHIQARAFSLPQVIGKSADVTFITKASKIAGSIVERKKDSFTVVWTTDQPTSTIVEYKDLKRGITERKTDDAKKTSHSMKIENLPSGTAYEVNLSGVTEAGNIAEAGSPLSVTTSTDVTPPVISGFKVDNALVPGRTDRIQTIVSWATDEPSNSTVYYEEGAGTAGDTEELANKNEILDSYVLSHSVILPSLKPGTIYRLKVTSNDDSGNLGSFGPRTVITPRQTESITDIIFKNFEDSFKFLRKI